MGREIIKSQVVTTKKQHNCYGCGRVFKSGTSMISAVCKINGSFGNKYFCESCHHTMVIKGKTIDKFWYGELLCEALAYENLKEIIKLIELPFKVEELQSEHTYLFVTECLDEYSCELWHDNVIRLSKILQDFGIQAVFLDKRHFGDISIYKLEKESNNK